MPDTFAALRHRNYRLFFAGQLVSLIGAWMQQLALAWLVYQLTKSPFMLGLVGTIGSAPTAILSVAGGVLADRVDKRRIIVTTQTVAMVLAFVLAGITAAGWVRWYHIALLAACSGTVMAFDMPARQAFVVEMVGKSELMNAIALNSTIFNSARILGPAIAGVLVAKLGPAWCFCINGVSFLAVLGGLLAMRFPPRPVRPRTATMIEDALGGLRYLRSNRPVMGLAALLAVFGVFGFSYQVLMPIFAHLIASPGGRDVAQGSARSLGYLMTATGLGALLGALVVASLTGYPRRRRILFGGGLLFAAAATAFSFSRHLAFSAPLLALAGFGQIAVTSSANTLIQTSVPDEVRGRIMGVWALVFAGSAPLGAFLTGTLAEYLGAPRAVRIGATIIAAAVVFAIFAARRWVEARGEESQDDG